MRRNSRSSRTRSTYTVDGLKSLFNLDHSEELFGITSEIPFQCPRIDMFIEDVEMISKHIKRIEELISKNENNINKDYLERECEILSKYEASLKQYFEELRKSCDELRTRGEGWKRLARNMFNDVPNNKRFIDSKFKV